MLSESCDIKVPWTVGNYMRSKHAGSGALKVGVGSTDVLSVFLTMFIYKYEEEDSMDFTGNLGLVNF